MELREALVGHEVLADALAACGVELAQLEASVRADEGSLRADRMMIERAADGALEAILEAFGVPRVAALDALLETARALGVPRIVGWDATRGCVKLYANASDAPASVRERLGAHVVGVNAFADGSIERKRYAQHPDASSLGPAASRLVEAAGALCAGVVESRDEGGAARAWFVALRPATPVVLDAAFGGLPGFGSFSWAALVERAPFAPASPRSIGIAAARPTEWTAYVKPRASAEPELWSLEPIAAFETDDVEVAVHVAPADGALRAYARVGDRALSYRVVRGEPAGGDLDALMRWVVERATDADDLRASLARVAPPGPWRLVS
ncbi:MAG: hypothetical protein H6719_24790 [Sandaracinaceae bacterium]|nr:hypothetical protein [Sandaracinaceae bacterium]